MERFQNLGKTLDSRQRVSLARANDDVHEKKIAAARKAIFRDGYAVDSRHLDDTLKAESWVPNVVSRR